MKNLYTFEQRNYIILAITILLGIYIFHIVQGLLLSAVLGAIVLYTIFRPWYLYLAERRKLRRWFSAIVVILLSFLILVLPVSVLISIVVNRAGDFVSNPKALQQLYTAVDRYTSDILHQPQLLRNLVSQVQSGLFQLFRNALSSAFDIFLQVTVMYFILYFMFVEHLRMEKALVKYSPFRPQATQMFAKELRDITYSNVIGQSIIAFTQGVLQAAGFWIFGIPEAIFWGIVTLFLAFLPVIGAPVIFVPASLIAMSQGNTAGGIGMMIYGFVLVINIDNVLRLAIAKRIGNIHPLITILGVVIGIPVFGMLGLVYGPLLLSFFILLIKVYESNQREILRNEHEP